jgi:hypothetical protein
MASFFYSRGLKECLNGTIVLCTTVLKIMLVDATYVPAKSDTVVDTGAAGDAESAEIDVANYAKGWGGAGRKTATITIGEYNLGETYRVDMAIADLIWTAVGSGVDIAGAVLIKEGTADDTTSRPIVYFDVTDTPTNGGDILLDFVALVDGGNMRVTL